MWYVTRGSEVSLGGTLAVVVVFCGDSDSDGDVCLPVCRSSFYWMRPLLFRGARSHTQTCACTEGLRDTSKYVQQLFVVADQLILQSYGCSQ